MGAAVKVARGTCRDCHKPQTNQEAVLLASLHGMDVEMPDYGGDHGPPPMTASRRGSAVRWNTLTWLM